MHLSEAVFINLDSYGVDHSGFSLRDELEYQTARQAREQVLKQNFDRQGKGKDYPQYGAGFWGRPENNYGFGSSDISRNIGERPFTPFPSALGGKEPPALRKEVEHNQRGLNGSSEDDAANEIPRYWETSADGRKVYQYVEKQEGNVMPDCQWPHSYVKSFVKAFGKIWDDKEKLTPLNYTDKYKHALINCRAAQYGSGGVDIARGFSWLKEEKDQALGSNTEDSSNADNYANKIGRLLGTKYPVDDCDLLVQKYIDKRHK